MPAEPLASEGQAAPRWDTGRVGPATSAEDLRRPLPPCDECGVAVAPFYVGDHHKPTCSLYVPPKEATDAQRG